MIWRSLAFLSSAVLSTAFTPSLLLRTPTRVTSLSAVDQSEMSPDMIEREAINAAQRGAFALSSNAGETGMKFDPATNTLTYKGTMALDKDELMEKTQDALWLLYSKKLQQLKRAQVLQHALKTGDYSATARLALRTETDPKTIDSEAFDPEAGMQVDWVPGKDDKQKLIEEWWQRERNIQTLFDSIENPGALDGEDKRDEGRKAAAEMIKEYRKSKGLSIKE
mmetsp:Transcript_50239/g.98932  ORF Transcript_50239/g.98932 Transcript_50239/m.98932 type:complete len:223 (+) Transcript_50239:134-802(+)